MILQAGFCIISKRFDDGQYYHGRVVSSQPDTSWNRSTRQHEQVWQVRYLQLCQASGRDRRRRANCNWNPNEAASAAARNRSPLSKNCSVCEALKRLRVMSSPKRRLLVPCHRTKSICSFPPPIGNAWAKCCIPPTGTIRGSTTWKTTWCTRNNFE